MSFSKFSRHSKYRNTQVVEPCHYGFSHRSKFERAVCALIRLREMAGELKHLGHEKHIRMGVVPYRVTYIADFHVQDAKSGEEYFIEAKGMETPAWKRKLKIYRYDGPAKLEVWKGDYKRPYLHETVIPKPKGAA